MGELPPGMRFVVEHANGELEELEAGPPPPPDMAAEVNYATNAGGWRRLESGTRRLPPLIHKPSPPIQTFTGHTGPVYAVAISPADPRCMLTGGGDDRAFLLRASTLPTPPFPPLAAEGVACAYACALCAVRVRCAVLSSSGGWALAFVRVTRFGLVTGLPPARELEDHGDSVSAVGFSCDGTMAATVRNICSRASTSLFILFAD